MKQNRTFSSQPYPLWAVVAESDSLWIGLVIGWVTYDESPDDMVTAYPVVHRLGCSTCTAYEVQDWASIHMALEDAHKATVEACRV